MRCRRACLGEGAVYHSAAEDPITVVEHDSLAGRYSALWRLELNDNFIAVRSNDRRDICAVISDARLNAYAIFGSDSRNPFHASGGQPVTQ